MVVPVLLACGVFFPSVVFFSIDPATTEIYTLSLHDALPICTNSAGGEVGGAVDGVDVPRRGRRSRWCRPPRPRSEEHTSELQSPCNLVCRLLLEKKKE